MIAIPSSIGHWKLFRQQHSVDHMKDAIAAFYVSSNDFGMVNFGSSHSDCNWFKSKNLAVRPKSN